MGLEYFINSGRTLFYKGKKQVEVNVHNVGAGEGGAFVSSDAFGSGRGPLGGGERISVLAGGRPACSSYILDF